RSGAGDWRARRAGPHGIRCGRRRTTTTEHDCGHRRRQPRGRGQVDTSAIKIARSVPPPPGEAERKDRLLALVDGFSSRRVLVIGDLIADEFIYGGISRISREAPVLILKYDATEIVAGGAGNAANNVAALGGGAVLAGMVGDDSESRRVLKSF